MDVRSLDEAVADLAARLGVRDGMVFRRVARTSWAHLGGIGRGRGWAGVVEVDASCDPLVELVPATAGTLSRVTNVPSARLLGPYYCVGGALVRVSEDVLVVLGNPQEPLADPGSDEDLLELARLLESTVEEAGPAKRLADELELLHAVRAVISLPAEHADEALSHVLKIALDSLSCEVGVIRDGRGRWARSAALSGPDVSSFQLKETLDRLEGLCASGSICFQDTSLVHTELAPLSHQDGVRSLLAVAIPRPVGGVLVVAHTLAAPRGFTALCVELGKHIAEAATVVAHTAALREELREAAEQHASVARLDPLTGLGNRLAWDEALSRAQERVDGGGCVTVITLDIDGLKRVNDTEGHAAGDALLRRCAAIIRENVRGDDVCARLGGDEFAVLVPHPEEQAERVLTLLRDRLNGVTSTEESTAASIGMATTTPFGRVADAVREADLAMYAVKRGRRDNPPPPPLVHIPLQAATSRRREPTPPTPH
jgi:diguanylate cyclase (GGDEF)-like protein